MEDSISDSQDVLGSYSYDYIRRLAQEHGVFKTGSKKKDALIYRLLKEVGVDSLNLGGIKNTESSEENLNISDGSDKTIATSGKKIFKGKLGKKRSQRKTKIKNSSESDLSLDKENVPVNDKKSDYEELVCGNKSILSPHKRKASLKKDLGNKKIKPEESFEHEQLFSSPTTIEKERRSTYFIDQKSISSNIVFDSKGTENRRETFSVGRKGFTLETSQAEASTQWFLGNTKPDDQENEISQVKDNRRRTFSVPQEELSKTPTKKCETLVVKEKCSSGSSIRGSLRRYQKELQPEIHNTSKEDIKTGKDHDKALDKSLSTAENGAQIDWIRRPKGVPKTPDVEVPLEVTTRNGASLHLNAKKSVAFNCLSPESGFRTPMKTKTTPHPAKKNASKLSGSFSAKKMPNFAAIHKKNFDQMESLLKYSSRKSERAKFLLSPAIAPFKSVEKKKLSSQNSLKKEISKRGKSCIPIRAKKSLPTVEHEDSYKIDYYKLHTTTKESLKEKNKEIIKGVRSNKRFRLQMKMRNLIE